jgi:hypothetical protein
VLGRGESRRRFTCSTGSHVTAYSLRPSHDRENIVLIVSVLPRALVGLAHPTNLTLNP